MECLNEDLIEKHIIRERCCKQTALENSISTYLKWENSGKEDLGKNCAAFSF
jgi:hypothetical protein